MNPRQVRPVRGRTGRSRGSASIEMVAILPVVLLMMLLAFYVIAVSYTTHAASQAARDAARAFSLDQSPQAAASASLPGGVSLVAVTTFGPYHGVRVEVSGPAMLPENFRRVERAVTMP